MIMNIAATVIADMIVRDLSALVIAVGTTSIHVNAISIAADHAVAQWTHLGHSALTSAVTLFTAALAVQEIVAAGVRHSNLKLLNRELPCGLVG